MSLKQKQQLKALAYGSMFGLIIGTALAGSFVAVFLLITTACFVLSDLPVTEDSQLRTCVEKDRQIIKINSCPSKASETRHE